MHVFNAEIHTHIDRLSSLVASIKGKCYIVKILYYIKFTYIFLFGQYLNAETIVL